MPSNYVPVKKHLPPGLYIVATPIGNLGDVSLRALEILASAELIACEDTRVTGKLLRHFDIRTPATAYHDHNAAKKRPELLAVLKDKAVALVSDAGTPMISDPGYKLVHEAIEAGIAVIPIPGASSVLAALTMSGLPTDAFAFIGFLPASVNAARRELEPYQHLPGSLVLFESPKRLAATLALLADMLGERQAAICREITKLYEEARRGSLSELAEYYKCAPEPRGEVVLVIGPEEKQPVDEAQLTKVLAEKLQSMSVKQAVAEVAEELGLPKNLVYKRALELQK